MYWYFDIALIAICFLSAGYLCRMVNAFNFIQTKKITLLMGIVGLVICSLSGYINMHFYSDLLRAKWLTVDMHTNHYGNILLFFISAFAGILMVICISKLFYNKSIVFVGKNTLIYYMLSDLTITISIFITKKVFILLNIIIDNYCLGLIYVCIYVTISCFFLAIISLIINRYFFFLVGKNRSKIDVYKK